MTRSAPRCRAGDSAEFLIGGITKADVQRDVGLVRESADPTTMLLPPLPNFLFQRDPSCSAAQKPASR